MNWYTCEVIFFSINDWQGNFLQNLYFKIFSLLVQVSVSVDIKFQVSVSVEILVLVHLYCQDMSIHALRHLFSFCYVFHSLLVSLDSRLTKTLWDTLEQKLNMCLNACIDLSPIQQSQSIFTKIYYLSIWWLIIFFVIHSKNGEYSCI